MFFQWVYQEYIISNYTNIKHIHPIHIINCTYFAFEQLITNACKKYLNYGKFWPLDCWTHKKNAIIFLKKEMKEKKEKKKRKIQEKKINKN